MKRVGVVVALALAALVAIRIFGRPYTFFDLKIYHGAVVWWAQGNDLYAFSSVDTRAPFTYPPFAALVMIPMASYAPATAGWINIAFSLVALTFVVAVAVTPIAQRHGWSPGFTIAGAAALAVAVEPVRESLGYGQINLILAALICADLVWRDRRWSGVGIGLATALKVTPALFIVHLLVTRQWRAAATAIGTAVGVTLAAATIVPAETWRYYTDIVWHTNRVGNADATPNQALSGLIDRLYDTSDTPTLLWATFALLVLFVGLSRAAAAHRDGDRVVAFTLVGLTANAVSPISWTHHLVFVVPAIIVLADLALRYRSRWRAAAAIITYALFVVAPVWIYEHKGYGVSHYADGLFGVLMESSFAIAVIVLVVALPTRPESRTVDPFLRTVRKRLALPHR